jgi:hypothetical protein
MLNVAQRWRLVVLLLLGLNSYWLAYSTMSMTDTFSIFLLIGWLYFIEKFFASQNKWNLVVASFLALANVSARYEAWVFLSISGLFLLFRSSSKVINFDAIRDKVSRSFSFIAPSTIFIIGWLIYCYVGKGDPLFFSHDPSKFLWSSSLYFHDLVSSASRLISCLLLTCGLLWIFPFYEFFKGNYRALFMQFSYAIFVYLAFTLFQLWSGVNAGFVRYWLPLLPISAIAFGVTINTLKTRWARIICLIVIFIATVYFFIGMQEIVTSHYAYNQTFGSDEIRLR